MAIAVFLILMVLMASFLGQATKLWNSNLQQAEAFQSARLAFQSMTLKLSQATLNTYWDYNSPTAPTSYIRQSELQFISGPAADVLNGTPSATVNPSTHAVFFLAPLGMTTDTNKKSLVGLLNAVGYYVHFGKLPQNTLISTAAPYRYGLYEFFQPTENLQIYASWASQTPFTTFWFTDSFRTNNPPIPRPYHLLAPNVIALILRPDDGTGSTTLAPNYFYDSRNGSTTGPGSYSAPNVASVTYNQLPPVMHVTMVAIDEFSAARLAQQNGTTAPPLVAASSFTDITKYDNDLAALSNSLIAKHLNYHIFNTDVAIRSSKWSP